MRFIVYLLFPFSIQRTRQHVNMAVVCSKCCKSISRYDDSISCSKDGSHIFHISCENVTVEAFQEMKKTGVIQNWKCSECCSLEVTSEILKMEKFPRETFTTKPDRTIDIIGDYILKSVETLVSPILNSLKNEISNLKDEVFNLKTENSELLKLLKEQVFKTYSNSQGSHNKTMVEKKKPNLPKQSYAQACVSSEARKENTLEQPLFAGKIQEKPNELSLSVPTSINTNSQVQSDTDSGFTSVENKRKSKRSMKGIIGTSQNVNLTISSAPKWGYLHVSNLDPSLGEDVLMKHLEANGIENSKCIKLKSNRPNEYSSFKITVPDSHFIAAKNPDLWPRGVRVNNFLFRLIQKESIR